jgi:hypothetical protein
MVNNMPKTRAVFFNGIPHVSDVFRREISPASADESGLLRKKRRKVQNASVITTVQSVL